MRHSLVDSAILSAHFKETMTSKERTVAALTGKPYDRIPVSRRAHTVTTSCSPPARRLFILDKH